MLPVGDLSSYRRVQLGMNLSTAAKQAGTNAREARTVHQRPGLIQESWRRAPMSDTASIPGKARPTFFNGGLFSVS